MSRELRQELGFTHATSDKYIDQIAVHEHQIEKANAMLLEARKAEIHRLFEYLWQQINEAKIKEYGVTDTVSDLETIVKQSLNIK